MVRLSLIKLLYFKWFSIDEQISCSHIETYFLENREKNWCISCMKMTNILPYVFIDMQTKNKRRKISVADQNSSGVPRLRLPRCLWVMSVLLVRRQILGTCEEGSQETGDDAFTPFFTPQHSANSAFALQNSQVTCAHFMYVSLLLFHFTLFHSLHFLSFSSFSFLLSPPLSLSLSASIFFLCFSRLFSFPFYVIHFYSLTFFSLSLSFLSLTLLSFAHFSLVFSLSLSQVSIPVARWHHV